MTDRSTAPWYPALKNAVDAQFDSMVALRRHMHMHPEVSGEEFDTSQLLYARFLDAGFQVRQGPNGCGVLVDFVTAQPTSPRTVFAFRADIDALRIQDEKDVSYRSQKPSVMHACGHDAHTAIVYGSMMALRSMWQEHPLPFEPSIRAIFQPAEETAQGAAQMIGQGALDGVGALIATHVDPSRTLGNIGLREGVLTASCDDMEITIHGRGGHAARPHEARDPIVAAAQLINALYMQIGRWTDSQDAVVCTIGRIDAGHHSNVIPEVAQLFGTLRTLDRHVRDHTCELILQLADSVARGTRTQIDVRFFDSTPPVVNDAGLVRRLWASAEEVVSREAPQWIPRSSMGSEDFALYAQQVPAAMFRLGCVSSLAGGAGLHTNMFDIDEEALRIGSFIMTYTALRWMEDNHAKNPVPTEYVSDTGR